MIEIPSTLLSLVQEPARALPKLPDSDHFWMPVDASEHAAKLDAISPRQPNLMPAHA